jgi:hypothetical protein
MVGVVVLIAAQLLEYIVESNESSGQRLRMPTFVRDLPPGDATAATKRTFEYEQAA